MNHQNHNSPLVSVLMTAYNREQYIAEAIESVLASTYSNFELIIVDDCSKDKTVEIANQYAAKDERIKLHINEKNLGDYANRNKAASYAQGKYLKYVDSDDKIYSWGISYCVEMMEKYPKAAIGLIVYVKDKIEAEYLQPTETIYKHFFENHILTMGPLGTILKRETFEAIGRYDAIYGPASDMYFNLKIAYKYPIVLLKDGFVFYRIHEGQESNNTYGYISHNYKYLLDAFNLPEFPLTKKQKTILLHRAEAYYAKNLYIYIKNTRNFKKAFHAFSISGMNIFKLARGIINLVVLKLKK